VSACLHQGGPPGAPRDEPGAFPEGFPLGKPGKQKPATAEGGRKVPRRDVSGWAAQTSRHEARSRVERRGGKAGTSNVERNVATFGGMDDFCPCGARIVCFICEACPEHCLTEGGPEACWEATVRTARDRVLDVEAEASQDRRRGCSVSSEPAALAGAAEAER
jgi:hypothetical protein